ncbi:TPA: type-F conjugative transfer system secretin TraK [Vibrio parahaemolyticus]|nr:type-F conjugative transfer system secretin TraK [Vibrio parahaemolyticus]WKV19494.1 hypothetical protein [Vibrio parahaemolyticus]BDP33481.1 hypothetical protein VV208B2_45610 [Vibrio vulnificus]BDP38278.1 hypothetical protein VA208B3_46490 [Vibrio alginolyticus]HBC3816138.1 type-F conjugative transfer system secretin TraK [Vibrio parahaemolyticus]
MKYNSMNKSALAMLLTVAFSSSAFAAEADVAADIPVTPMNASRVPVDISGSNGNVANAVDQAIMDAVAKSMPAKSVAEYKASQQAQQPVTVDSYGMPVVQGTKVKTVDTAPVYTQQGQPPAIAATPVPSAAPQVKGSSDPITDSVRSKYKPHQEVTIEPGHGELLPVAAGLQNRIATPFVDAVVKTADMEVPIQTDGGFVYITPLSQAPIGLMVGERGMPETMVSLTLMPLDVPPVMVDVKVKMDAKTKAKHSEYIAKLKSDKEKNDFLTEARKGPTVKNDPRVNTEHEDRATSVLSEVAGGNIPNGFDITTDIPAEERYPCDIVRMGMYHEVGQRMISGREIIDVVLVKNDINGFREVREEYCLADDVIAVGVFDRATLAPGETTELYILRDKLYNEKLKRVRTRPRLTSSY